MKKIKRKAHRPPLSYHLGIDGPLVKFPRAERQKFSWTDDNLWRASIVTKAVKELWDFRPFTVRQIYYRVMPEVFEGLNTDSKYQIIVRLLSNMRYSGRLDWKLIEDRSRELSRKRGWSDSDAYMEEENEVMYAGYERCYVQDQENHVEIWIEKDALAHIVRRVATPHCVQVLTGRGYQSVTVKHDYVLRARRAIELGKIPNIIYFGDFDPDGLGILKAVVEDMRDIYKLPEVRFHRVALNLDQIVRWELPHVPLKTNDKKYKAVQAHKLSYGDVGVELDALHPLVLQELAVNAMESLFDMENIELHKDIEKQELLKIAAKKKRMLDVS